MGAAVDATLGMAKALGDARKIVVSRQRLEFTTPIPLRLLLSETFKPGVLNLVYGPARSPGDATTRTPRSTCPSPTDDNMRLQAVVDWG